MSRVIVIVLSVIIMIGMLGSCASKEAQKVIDEINSIDKISLNSFNKLETINKKYNKLKKEQQKEVLNYDKLVNAYEKYNELKYKDLNKRIDKACKDDNNTDLSKLNKLYDEYLDLSKEGKAKIKNINILEKTIEKCKKSVAAEATEDIIYDANGNIDSAKEELYKNADYMTEKQIKECLIEIGRWDSVDEAEKKLEDYLKDPDSYKRYSASCGKPEKQKDGTYKTLVKLDYGANNSFNASIRDETDFYVYFEIEVDNLDVYYTKTTLTPYYAWELAKS